VNRSADPRSSTHPTWIEAMQEERFRVPGSGFRVQGSGVHGSGLKIAKSSDLKRLTLGDSLVGDLLGIDQGRSAEGNDSDCDA